MKQRRTGRSTSAFDGWYGDLYDLGVSGGRLSRLAAYGLWGCDYDRVLRAMSRGLCCEPGEVVLDVPAGSGVTLSAGSSAVRGLVIGVDLSRGMLQRAARRRAAARLEDRVALVRADAARLPLGHASVDRVLCFNSLHCLSAGLQVAALAEFRRVLKPGGRLVGTTLVADAPPPWRATVAAARLSGFFTPPEAGWLADQAARAGFAGWRQDRHGALLFFGGQ